MDKTSVERKAAGRDAPVPHSLNSLKGREGDLLSLGTGYLTCCNMFIHLDVGFSLRN